MGTKLKVFCLVVILSFLFSCLFYYISSNSDPITNVKRLKSELLRTWERLNLLCERVDQLKLEAFLIDSQSWEDDDKSTSSEKVIEKSEE